VGTRRVLEVPMTAYPFASKWFRAWALSIASECLLGGCYAASDFRGSPGVELHAERPYVVAFPPLNVTTPGTTVFDFERPPTGRFRLVLEHVEGQHDCLQTSDVRVDLDLIDTTSGASLLRDRVHLHHSPLLSRRMYMSLSEDPWKCRLESTGRYELRIRVDTRSGECTYTVAPKLVEWRGDAFFF
jgi:hypothetical protein